MPRPPEIAAATRAMPGAVFSPVAHRLRSVPGGAVPLHVGDTWMAPCEGARVEDLREADLPGLHRYCETRGIPSLVEALVEKLRVRNDLVCEPDQVVVTAGATGALGAALGAIASPGDEVMILAPFWPLIRGVVEAFRATPVEVPFFDRIDSAKAAVEALRAQVTRRTVALYVSTPSNPTGRMIPGEWLEAIAEFAASQELWLLSDEVYERSVYRGEHVSIARFAPERTLSVFSFSKAYGMAGNRVGYLTGPAEVITEALKISTHTFYAAPTAGQWAALAALERGDEWLERARTSYREVADETARMLGIAPPDGSNFHFLDVSHRLDERGIWGFLEDCLDDGVALAPGPSCGSDYAGWVRLCYTAAPPDAVRGAVEKVARRIR